MCIPSFEAIAAVDEVKYTSVCLLVDKEEIGSVGATGMQSRFFENTVAEVMNACGQYSELLVRRALKNSKMLSSDVSAAFDPNYPEVMEKKNSAYLAMGSPSTNIPVPEEKAAQTMPTLSTLLSFAVLWMRTKVSFQTAELGKVDAGGGGTIATFWPIIIWKSLTAACLY